jgi:hypothetical protein
MSTTPGSEGKRTALAAAGFLLLPILCCGLPLLIAAGALGAVGSVLGNPWVIAAAVALLIGLLPWRLRRRPPSSGGSSGSACCPPEPPTGDTPPERVG